MKRRGFIAAIGAALATSPETIAKHAGIGLDPLSQAFPLSSLVSGDPPGNPAGAVTSYARRRLLKFNLLKQFNPDWFNDKRRENAKYVGRLDLDLASLQSVSLAGKVAIQRERNFQRALDDEYRYLSRDLEEELFSERMT